MNCIRYNMNNVAFKTVDIERYLEVVINKNGKYSEQCLKAAKKTNCVLGMITRNIKFTNAANIVRFYKSLVRPKLKYCIQAWSPYHKKILKFWKEYKIGLQKWYMGVGI